MNGNIFAVFTKKDEIMGLYAIAEKIPKSNNLICYMKNCVTFNVCNSWKEAKEIAKQWNESFKNNGLRLL